MATTTLLVLIALATLIYFYVRTFFTSPLSHLPGPWYTRLSTVPLKLAVLGGRRIFFIHSLHQRYGPIVRIAPTEASVSSLDSLKAIYTSTNGWRKSQWYAGLSTDVRVGIFSSLDPGVHGARRRLLASPFSNSAMRDNWEATIRVRAEVAVHQVLAEVKEKGVSDVLKWFTLMANDIACEVLFGDAPGQLEAGQKTEKIHTMEAAMIGISIMNELPWLKKIVKLTPWASKFTLEDEFVKYGRVAVHNARDSATKSNIFHNIIRKSKEDTDKLDDLAVCIEAGNLMVAASDTTSNTMTYLIWNVMKRPAVRAQLEQELRGLPAQYNDAALDELPYLNAVINETLRLYGAAPGSSPREVPQPGVVLNGYTLPGGVDVSAQPYTVHRSNEYFEKAEEYDPSRWLRSQSATEKTAFIPWGTGPRSCLGIHMARMEMHYATALFFRAGIHDPSTRLRLAPSATDANMAELNYFLIAPTGGKLEVRSAT